MSRTTERQVPLRDDARRRSQAAQQAPPRATALHTVRHDKGLPEQEPVSELPGDERTALNSAVERPTRARFLEGEDGELVRRIVLPRSDFDSRIDPSPGSDFDSPAAEPDLEGRWLRSYLSGVVPQTLSTAEDRALRTVDLFCGAGGFALSVRQLAAETGHTVVNELAVDVDEAALAVFSANHRTGIAWPRSVASLVDFRIRGHGRDARFAYPPEILNEAVAGAVGNVDLITAGPPCQGHSNLNNRSRRDDRRNRLFLTVPAFAIAAGARAVAIENVPAVVHARDAVVDAARRLFEDAGYKVDAGVIAAGELGWPQTRQRYFLVARRSAPPLPLDSLTRELRAEPRSVWWAIRDLENDTSDDDPMTTLSNLSDENAARIQFLFENDQLDLPPAERPDCHRDGTTYQAVYGRMDRERPAPTITTGFMSPGRGRFIHPTRPRTLTPREAARLQGFPDTYRFVLDPNAPPTRHQLGKWIGDAVPMPLGYVAALSALGPDLPLEDRSHSSES